MEYYSFLLENLAFYSVDLGIRYFACALVGFGVLWMGRRWIAGKRPLPKLPKSRQIRREIAYSLATIVICGCIAPAIIVLGLGANLNFYGEIGDYGWVYFIFSILLMMFLRDTMFYWEHRMMHTPKLYPHLHHVHHLSFKVTPLSGLSIHPLEALVASVIPYTLILFLVPKHPTAYLIFVWTDAAVAVVTHLGYETFPRGFARHRVGRWIGTATAHEAHHTKPGCNFGLYFLFWDRLMGTLDPEYEANFDKATATEPRAKDEKDETVLTA
ncbi:sterol desaturase family protein [Sagittula sp. NFXS13]|uniref:Sterol desaturase/sphingolipid hydroxylase (Fatty acid hydroxylase superfamily) n=1 Tax=Sagittula marina TaxID=943940 RepID=A0A7W6DK35_9RHOB|nr:sterol desaturase family protein [Sagittula marina]MBB3984685.1 sterol desaturase/sphingolipid hydroxylase (fatty acid hydroxylase superfamily) [Sagittula marina]